MRYFHEKPPIWLGRYGETYACDHPVYGECTLYRMRSKGLAVIQQRFDGETKRTWWGPIDPWLADSLYLTCGFKAYFDERAKEPVDGLYPTVTVRQAMWALRMKPLKRERWETVFDRKDI